MHASYMSLEKPAGSHTENTFSIWRSRNRNVRMNLNRNKLANARRDIVNKKRLTDIGSKREHKNMLMKFQEICLLLKFKR